MELVLWAMDQFAGLAEALQILHSPITPLGEGGGGTIYGWHGDIKPDNILRFREPSMTTTGADFGTLQIADLGLCRFHREKDSPPTWGPGKGRGGTLAYESPPDSSSVPARADIWTLGCVYLEFAI